MDQMQAPPREFWQEYLDRVVDKPTQHGPKATESKVYKDFADALSKVIAIESTKPLAAHTPLGPQPELEKLHGDAYLSAKSRAKGSPGLQLLRDAMTIGKNIGHAVTPTIPTSYPRLSMEDQAQLAPIMNSFDNSAMGDHLGLLDALNQPNPQTGAPQTLFGQGLPSPSIPGLPSPVDPQDMMGGGSSAPGMPIFPDSGVNPAQPTTGIDFSGGPGSEAVLPETRPTEPSGAVSSPLTDLSFGGPSPFDGPEGEELAKAEQAAQDYIDAAEPKEPSYLQQVFAAMASSITPALIAWAAEKYQAPAIYQAYAQQEAQKLAQAKWEAEQELEQQKLQAQTDAEKTRAVLEERRWQLQQAQAQNALMENIRDYNRNFTGDPQEWSTAMQGYILNGEVLGIPQDVIVETTPYPMHKALQRMQEQFEKYYKSVDGDPSALQMAVIDDLTNPDGGRISGIEFLIKTGQIDVDSGKVVLPTGLVQKDMWMTRNQQGMEEVTQKLPYETLGKTAIRYPVPQHDELDIKPTGTDDLGMTTFIQTRGGKIEGMFMAPTGSPRMEPDPFGIESGRTMPPVMQSARNTLKDKVMAEYKLADEEAERWLNTFITNAHLSFYATFPETPIEDLINKPLFKVVR